jgi:hypothetical protein
MSNDRDTLQLFAALLQWIQSATVRVAALEGILKQHLNLSNEELDLALEKSALDYPLAIEDTDAALDQILDFLKRATNAKETSAS